MGKDRKDRFGGRMALLAWAASAAFFATVLSPTVTLAAGIGGGGIPNPPGPTRGGPAPGPPAMTTSPVQAVPAQKKPIQINPAILDAVYLALLKTDVKAEQEEFGASLQDAQHVFGSGKHSLWYYQSRAKQCATKTYTTEDQKKAGCLGSDTVNQCSTKLFNECFSHYKNDSFLTYRKKMLESADRLDKALKAYTGKLKVIPAPK